ncbi:uncharacterized protein PRCAT00000540001 [Priceomyces carsonii]|uniref:uncharacterized protein n=1 Tax=Priceomyces carsonii TaxID=28549 RepID=UPI002EDB6FB1|nr:unnamed protein product [Priceomyces carsonii]
MTGTLQPDIIRDSTQNQAINQDSEVLDLNLYTARKAQEFIKTHQNKWVHGIRVPRSVFEYEKITHPEKSWKSSGHNIIFAPRAVLKEAPQAAFVPVKQDTSSSEGDSSDSFKAQARASIVKRFHNSSIVRKDEGQSSFSGYFSVPNTMLNSPHLNPYYHSLTFAEVPKLCYQNHYSLKDRTYTFGGLQINSKSDLSYLGIPKDVPAEKISVNLPDDLPPHFNREILSNPLMTQNVHLIMLNQTRNTLTSLDVRYFPWHLNSLVSCEISDRHIFFYGGFLMNTEAVTYDREIDRWIIEKRIHLNEDGYILDTTSLRFTKVQLKARDDQKINIGRLGSAVTSNIYQFRGNNNVPSRVPLPPIFTDHSSQKSPSESPIISPLNASVPKTDTFKLPEAQTSSASISSSSDTSLFTGVFTNSNSASNSVSNSKTTSQTTPRQISKVVTSAKSHTTSEPTKSPTLNASKVGQVISKSSRIFHRPHQRQHSSTMSKTNDTEFKNSYSNQVRQHRSNSLHQQAVNRPVSPLNSLGNNTSQSTPEGETKSSYKHTPLPTPTDSIDCRNLDAEFSNDGYKGEAPTEQSKTQSENFIFNSSPVAVSIFVFGGFICQKNEEGNKKFVGSLDLLKIDINVKDRYSSVVHFEPEGSVSLIDHNKDLLSSKGTSEWPSPRGYFAFSLIDYNQTLVDRCERTIINDVDSEHPTSPVSNTSGNSFYGSIGTELETQEVPEEFFNGKALLIQGGINEKSETFSDFYLFVFDTERWHKLSTYAYDYFDSHIDPYEDEDLSLLEKQEEVKDPKLADAELRACYHTSMYYKNDQKHYVFFFGGFGNDYLRFFDKTPYSSDKLDITRFARFQFATTNNHVNRIAVLNLQTQTWRFLKYFFNVSHILSDEFVNRLVTQPYWTNTRISNYAGCISLNGKTITVSHGLVAPVPEKREDREKLLKETQDGSLLWGVRVHFTFPGL